MGDNRLILAAGQWYGWQVLGAATGWGTTSPMQVRSLTPMKTGKNLLKVEILHLLGTLEPALREETWAVRWRGRDLLIAETVGEAAGSNIVQALAPLSTGWLKQHCERFWSRYQYQLPYAFHDASAWEPPGPAIDLLFGSRPDEYCDVSQGGVWQEAQPPSRTGFIALDELEAWILLRGLRADDMDQKWIARAAVDDSADTGTLQLRRSWTGVLVHAVRFAIDWQRGQQMRLTGVEVNLDRSQYAYGTREGERRACLANLGALLFPWRREWWPTQWEPPPSEQVIDADWGL